MKINTYIRKDCQEPAKKLRKDRLWNKFIHDMIEAHLQDWIEDRAEEEAQELRSAGPQL